MIDFKQFADECLNKKLSGHFILRSGGTIHSNRLQKLGFYRFTHWEYAYNEVGECINGPHCWDIIKFEPNMSKENDKRNIQITLQQAKEWYNSGDNTLKTLALSSFDKLELDPYPRNWEEYLKIHPGTLIHAVAVGDLGEKLMTYGALLLLREEWIRLWSKDHGYNETWNEQMGNTIRLDIKGNIFVTTELITRITAPLRFPTKELAVDFKNTFKNYLERAKGLY